MARELGGFTCLAIGMTTIVGSGVFALPPLLAQRFGPLSFLAFVGAAALMSLVGSRNGWFGPPHITTRAAAPLDLRVGTSVHSRP